MQRRRHSREDAVGKYRFVDLYQGALRIKDRTKRLAAVTFVLLTGRLKMRISEAFHFHEGWYRRKYGIIEIPAFEPCGCKYCWERAEDNHREEDDYESVYDRFTSERYRTKNRRVRYVPVNWCPRIIACIETYLDEIGAYPKSSKTVARLLPNHILPNSDHFEAGDIDWSGMRATGDTFWAFSALSPKERAEMGGHREAELGTYSGSSPIELSHAVRESQGMEPLEMPDFDPVTSTAAPHPREPFQDPREVDPLENYSPFSRQPAINPRTEKRPADVDFDMSDFSSLAVGTKQPSMEEIRALVDRFSARLDGSPEETVDPYKDAYGTITENDVHKGQTILNEFNHITVSPLGPVAYLMAKGGEVTHRRLEKEWSAVKPEDGNLKGTQELIKGAAVLVPFVILAGILLASTGIYIDPESFQMHFSLASTAGLGLGSVIGVSNVLWEDCRKQIDDITVIEFLKRSLVGYITKF